MGAHNWEASHKRPKNNLRLGCRRGRCCCVINTLIYSCTLNSSGAILECIFAYVPNDKYLKMYSTIVDIPQSEYVKQQSPYRTSRFRLKSANTKIHFIEKKMFKLKYLLKMRSANKIMK
jgi:hypothetical protein